MKLVGLVLLLIATGVRAENKEMLRLRTAECASILNLFAISASKGEYHYVDINNLKGARTRDLLLRYDHYQDELKPLIEEWPETLTFEWLKSEGEGLEVIDYSFGMTPEKTPLKLTFKYKLETRPENHKHEAQIALEMTLPKEAGEEHNVRFLSQVIYRLKGLSGQKDVFGHSFTVKNLRDKVIGKKISFTVMISPDSLENPKLPTYLKRLHAFVTTYFKSFDHKDSE